MRKMLPILLLTIILPFLTSCDGHRIMNIELGRFPINIVYYLNEADYVDLTGATVIMELRDGRVFDYQIDDANAERRIVITDNIDFSTPGVYEVTIRWTFNDDLVGRIPIQIIEREAGHETVDDG